MISEDDGAKFQRSQAKASKRQARLASQGEAEALAGEVTAAVCPRYMTPGGGGVRGAARDEGVNPTTQVRIVHVC